MSAEAPIRLVEDVTEEVRAGGQAIQQRFDELFYYAGSHGLAGLHPMDIELSDALPHRSIKRPALATEWFPSLDGQGKFRLVVVKKRFTRFRNFGLIEQQLPNNPQVRRVVGIYPDGTVFHPYITYDQVEHSGGYREVINPAVLDTAEGALDSFDRYLPRKR